MYRGGGEGWEGGSGVGGEGLKTFSSFPVISLLLLSPPFPRLPALRTVASLNHDLLASVNLALSPLRSMSAT